MYFIQPVFRGLMLNITDDCNLRCKYCFVNKSPNYMTFKVAKDALDLLITINKPINVVPSLTFFGGEPLLCWDSIIKPLVNYTKDINEPVEFHITSNGTLLDEEKLKFMQENNISLLLSMDGIKECQDFNRPFADGRGTFDTLKDKLPLIIKYLPDTTFRATIYPETCHTLYEDIKFAQENGFKTMFNVPDEWSTWTEEQKQTIAEQLGRYTDDYIKAITNKTEIIDFSPISHMFTLFNPYRQIIDDPERYPVGNYCNCQLPACGLGIDYASVNYEGKIFACQELPTNNELNSKYYIGDIYNGIDKEKHDKLVEEFKRSKLVCVDETKCETCVIKPICNKMLCHANSYLLTKTMYKKSEIKCFWDSLLFNEAGKIINSLGKNEDFINIYLKGIFNEQH